MGVIAKLPVYVATAQRDWGHLRGVGPHEERKSVLSILHPVPLPAGRVAHARSKACMRCLVGARSLLGVPVSWRLLPCLRRLRTDGSPYRKKLQTARVTPFRWPTSISLAMSGGPGGISLSMSVKSCEAEPLCSVTEIIWPPPAPKRKLCTVPAGR